MITRRNSLSRINKKRSYCHFISGYKNWSVNLHARNPAIPYPFHRINKLNDLIEMCFLVLTKHLSGEDRKHSNSRVEAKVIEQILSKG